MKKLIFLLSILFISIQASSQCGKTQGSLYVNEIGNLGSDGRTEYVELVVVGNPFAPNEPVDLTGWIIDDNNISELNVGNEPGHIVILPCFPKLKPGTIILLSGGGSNTLTTNKEGIPVYDLSVSSPCLKGCTTYPNHESPSYDCPDEQIPPSGWDEYLPMRNFGDIMQVRTPGGGFVHGIYWGDAPSEGGVKIPIPDTTAKGLSFEFVGYNQWFDASQFDVSTDGGSPGFSNSPENLRFLKSMYAGIPVNQLKASLVVLSPSEADTATGVLEFTLEGGKPPYTIIKDDLEYTFDQPGVFTFQEISPGRYDLVVRDANGCETGCQAVMRENLIVAEKIEPVCAGSSVWIGEPGIKYECIVKWTPLDGIVNPHKAYTEVFPTENTTYTLEVTYPDGQYEVYEYEVEVIDVQLTITPEKAAVCHGEPVELNAITTETGGTLTYAWSNGSTEPYIEVSQPGTYSLTVTLEQDGKTCEYTASREVKESNIQVMIRAPASPCGSYVAVETGHAPFSYINYKWNTGATTKEISLRNSKFKELAVEVSDKTGCWAQATTKVEDFGLSYIYSNRNPTSPEEKNIIPPGPVIVCPTDDWHLEARRNGVQSIISQWYRPNSSSSEYGQVHSTPNTPLKDKFGIFQVETYLDSDCIIKDEIEVLNGGDPLAIKAFFESRNFYSTDIAIATEKSGGSVLDCSVECSTPLCVKDWSGNRPFSYKETGERVINLAEQAQIQMQELLAELGQDKGKIFITTNDQVCNCPGFLEKLETEFLKSGLSVWIHLYASPSGQDLMFTKTSGSQKYIAGKCKESPKFCIEPLDDQILTCTQEHEHSFLMNNCVDQDEQIKYCLELSEACDEGIPPGSEYEKLLEYIRFVRDLTCSRCIQYGEYCDFLQNWVADFYASSDQKTIEEVYGMALFCKSIKDDICIRNLKIFSDNVVNVLNISIAYWETKAVERIFLAVPPQARNIIISTVIKNLAAKVSPAFSRLKYAQRFGIASETELKKLISGLKLGDKVEVHHLVEQRFASIPEVQAWLGKNTKDWPCIVVQAGKAEHYTLFTEPWKRLIGYVGKTPGKISANINTANLSDVQKAAREVYKDYPEVLKILGL